MTYKRLGCFDAFLGALLGFMATVLPAGSPIADAGGADAIGPAQVVDGETLTVKGQRFCLAGIDAPEPGQICVNRFGKSFDCSIIAGTALMDLTAGAFIKCRTTGDKRGDCNVAVCEARGYDLSGGMVYTGWAMPDPATGAKYERLAALAKKRKHGLWRGSFEMPWLWRKANQGAKKPK